MSAVPCQSQPWVGRDPTRMRASHSQRRPVPGIRRCMAAMMLPWASPQSNCLPSLHQWCMPACAGGQGSARAAALQRQQCVPPHRCQPHAQGPCSVGQLERDRVQWVGRCSSCVRDLLGKPPAGEAARACTDATAAAAWCRGTEALAFLHGTLLWHLYVVGTGQACSMPVEHKSVVAAAAQASMCCCLSGRVAHEVCPCQLRGADREGYWASGWPGHPP